MAGWWQQHRDEALRDLMVALVSGVVISVPIAAAAMWLDVRMADRQEALENARFVRERGADPGTPKPFAGLNLRRALLTGVSFPCGTTEFCARFDESDLRQANLRFAGLGQASLRSADLSQADLTYADLSKANLADADLSKANLTDVDLMDAYLGSGDEVPGGADLTQADLTDADLTNADFSNADLTGADLISAYLSGTDFTGATLVGADLTAALLSEKDVGSDLVPTDFTSPRFHGADLTGANLRSADVSGALFQDTTLADVCYDEYTLWPEDFSPPAVPDCEDWPDPFA